MCLKSRETPSGKPLLHKDKSILGSEYVCNYRSAVGMLSYIKGSTRPEISMAIHQCEIFFNNPRLVYRHTTRRIEEYPASTSTHVDFPDGNRQLSTCVIVYKPN